MWWGEYFIDNFVVESETRVLAAGNLTINNIIKTPKMKRTLIDQFVRATLLVPMCIVIFSFVSCSGDDDDDETTSSNTTYTKDYTAVDLGLSVNWATCNVGAESPEDYGGYFAWGETETKDDYTSSTSTTYGVDMDDISGDAEYDAATANWGGSWRMPTYDEICELVDICTWEWTTLNDVNGYLVTGLTGNSIFLPAAGYRDGTSLYSAGSIGYYWSSTPRTMLTYNAYGVYFYSSYYDVSSIYRNFGRSVRPVTE